MTLSTEPQHLLKVYASFNVTLSLYDNVAYIAGGHEVPGISLSFYVMGEGLGLRSPGEKVLCGHLVNALAYKKGKWSSTLNFYKPFALAMKVFRPMI
jgi:hypothetical protein